MPHGLNRKDAVYRGEDYATRQPRPLTSTCGTMRVIGGTRQKSWIRLVRGLLGVVHPAWPNGLAGFLPPESRSTLVLRDTSSSGSCCSNENNLYHPYPLLTSSTLRAHLRALFWNQSNPQVLTVRFMAINHRLVTCAVQVHTVRKHSCKHQTSSHRKPCRWKNRRSAPPLIAVAGYDVDIVSTGSTLPVFLPDISGFCFLLFPVFLSFATTAVLGRRSKAGNDTWCSPPIRAGHGPLPGRGVDQLTMHRNRCQSVKDGEEKTSFLRMS